MVTSTVQEPGRSEGRGARPSDGKETREQAEMCEGFAVQTLDGLIFTVKGLLHPPDRVIAYLRYVPDPQGDRIQSSVRYRRVYHFEEQLEFLRARYPDYLKQDPVFGLLLQSVPRRLIRTAYNPCDCLARLRRQGPADRVEEHALGLAEVLQTAAGVPWENLGISGSLMVGTHTPDSDVDVIVYGEAAGRAVHQALRSLLRDPTGPVRRPNWEELSALHAMHRPDTPLSFTDFTRLQNRKVNEGRFQGREYFVRFVKWPADGRHPAESGERYGDRCFEPLGEVTIRARVTDDRDAIFTPCCYSVADVTFLDGSSVADLREVTSFRGRFSEQVRSGEWAVARGSLERVAFRVKTGYHRLVVGGRAGDYLVSESVVGAR
jgi:predicted nucleotidyltransferase